MYKCTSRIECSSTIEARRNRTSEQKFKKESNLMMMLKKKKFALRFELRARGSKPPCVDRYTMRTVEREVRHLPDLNR